MKITQGLEHIQFVANTAATLGSYDGLHLGHRDILRVLTDKTKQEGLSRSVVLTFDPHPQEILRKNDSDIYLLTTINERLTLIADCGVDEAVIIKFSTEFSQTTYRDFFNQVLVDRLGTTAMVVGHDHAFGKNREGDIAHLHQLASERSVSVTEVPPHLLGTTIISSTKIRRALLGGDIKTANAFLGRAYSITGKVVAGDKLGRALGFPTANLQVASNKLIPKDGIYSGRSVIAGKEHIAAISIGTRPTITNTGHRTIEAFLLNYSGDLYGSSLTIELHSFLREQIRFNSLEELKDNIANDVATIRQISA